MSLYLSEYLCPPDSPLGTCVVLHSGTALHLVEFRPSKRDIGLYCKKTFPGIALEEAPLPSHINEAFSAYFRGDIRALDTLVTAPHGSDFEKKVWAALRTIPAGETTTYGALVSIVGGHARAVGRANGANPISIVQPCHRVIGADGSLTGYAGGLDRKVWLLAHEGAGYLPL